MSAAPVSAPKKSGWAEIGLIGFIFSVLLWMILPLQPWMLDFLLALSISSGLLVMLVIIYIREPSEFTSFPTLLLIITLFRLGINVASTRLILGEAQAGQIIQSFGNVVVQGNYVVGFVVFIILTVINFVVITKGAGRIAEVAARFTLDAMPGKQMAIDAELNAGLIKEDQARKRRDDLTKEADFYGSMDGASKFVRGDAIAGILITLVNVIGGIGIGVIQRGMDVGTALQTYTVLSIGDGLVSQIPALVISTAAGILVTRTAERQSLGQTLAQQLFYHPKVLMALSFTMFTLAGFSLITGVLPWFPFLMMGALFGFMYRTFLRKGLLTLKPAGGPDMGPDGMPGGSGTDGGSGGGGEFHARVVSGRLDRQKSTSWPETSHQWSKHFFSLELRAHPGAPWLSGQYQIIVTGHLPAAGYDRVEEESIVFPENYQDRGSDIARVSGFLTDFDFPAIHENVVDSL